MLRFGWLLGPRAGGRDNDCESIEQLQLLRLRKRARKYERQFVSLLVDENAQEQVSCQSDQFTDSADARPTIEVADQSNSSSANYSAAGGPRPAGGRPSGRTVESQYTSAFCSSRRPHAQVVGTAPSLLKALSSATGYVSSMCVSIQCDLKVGDLGSCVTLRSGRARHIPSCRGDADASASGFGHDGGRVRSRG